MPDQEPTASVMPAESFIEKEWKRRRERAASPPDWLTETPEEEVREEDFDFADNPEEMYAYQLCMNRWFKADVPQAVFLQRCEFILLKRYLAKLRGFNAPEVKTDASGT